jgi:hypothetical protein
LLDFPRFILTETASFHYAGCALEATIFLSVRASEMVECAGPEPGCEGGETVRSLLLPLIWLAVGFLCLANCGLAAEEKDSTKAAATRKLLKTKVSVDYKDTPLSDVIDDIKDQIKEKTKKTLAVLKDNKGGVSNNTKFTYKAEDKPLEEVLDEMFKKNDLGYIVITKGAYDGALMIVKGKARGYPVKKNE